MSKKTRLGEDAKGKNGSDELVDETSMAPAATRAGRRKPQTTASPPVDVSSSERTPAQKRGVEQSEQAPLEDGDVTESETQTRPLRRRTTRTIRKDGESYTSETTEVVEDFDAPQLIERVPAEHPHPVG